MIINKFLAPNFVYHPEAEITQFIYHQPSLIIVKRIIMKKRFYTPDLNNKNAHGLFRFREKPLGN